MINAIKNAIDEYIQTLGEFYTYGIDEGVNTVGNVTTDMAALYACCNDPNSHAFRRSFMRMHFHEDFVNIYDGTGKYLLRVLYADPNLFDIISELVHTWYQPDKITLTYY